ncbi:hypothetical protein BD769DRAFT_1510246 [Suillus cothurnatus]|nr:hypothetical protein BD769DRAFT_1510246 [Suillus cothurnatus]
MLKNLMRTRGAMILSALLQPPTASFLHSLLSPSHLMTRCMVNPPPHPDHELMNLIMGSRTQRSSSCLSLQGLGSTGSVTVFDIACASLNTGSWSSLPSLGTDSRLVRSTDNVHADELSAARQQFHPFYETYRGDVVPVIVVVKGLDDRRTAHQWVEKHIMFDGARHLSSTFAPAEQLGYDSLRQQAEQELQELIRQACLIRSERKVKGGQKRL